MDYQDADEYLSGQDTADEDTRTERRNANTEET